MTFDVAQEICHAIDGSLAAPELSRVLDLLKELATDAQQFWTGTSYCNSVPYSFCSLRRLNISFFKEQN